MRFQQLYSGSEGNAYLVTSSTGRKLLVECGVTWKKMLASLNYDLSEIDCCLITHHHKDHCKSASDVMLSGIDCYASKETWQGLELDSSRRKFRILDGVLYERGAFKFRAYPSNHDVPGSLLFVIKADSEFLLFVTDSAWVSQKFPMPFNIIAIECSYDPDILREREENKEIDGALAKRLLTSHMSKYETMRYIKEDCDLEHCREINLLHLSSGNMGGTAAEIKAEFEDEFMIDVRTV